MYKLVIDGKVYEVVKEVADLMESISRERDELKIELHGPVVAPGPTAPPYPKDYKPKA